MLNQKWLVYFTFSLGLLMVGGSFLTGIHLWLAYLANQNNTSEGLAEHKLAEHKVIQTTDYGIRQIISTPPKNTVTPQSPVAPRTAHSAFSQKQSNPSATPSPRLVKKQSHEASQTAAAKSPVLVVYDDEMIIEFPKQLATPNKMKHAITHLLLSDKTLGTYDLLAPFKLNLSKAPYLYQHVLNEKKQAIRYPKQAYAYVDSLIKNNADTITDEEGTFVQIHIPLVSVGLKGPAKNYQAWVKNYADEFDVNPALVYAIMETESHFNPKAVSRSRAIGLMQLKRGSAGKDVYQYVDGKMGMPSIKELFDSDNNIRMGTAYLGLLQHDYLGLVENPKIQKMLTISSYNGGLSTVLKLFAKTPEKAIERVNRMSPYQVYRKLRFQHHSEETRRYLDKVLAAESRYQKMLNVKRL